MPQIAESEPLLIKAAGALIESVLAALSLTNTNVTVVTDARYQRARSSDKGKAYVLYDVNDTVDHSRTRTRVWNDHLLLVSSWAPDPGSAAEMAAALEASFTEEATGGVAANISLTGFTVLPVLRQFCRTSNDEQVGLDDYFGKSLGLVVIARPD